MNRELLITLEVLLVVVSPLLLLYLRSRWPQSKTTPCLVVIPVLWSFVYAPLHELSHVAGTYLAGGRVIETKLFLRPWLGDFGPAWIRSEGVTQTWQQMTSTTFPYLLDVICIVVGLYIIRPRIVRNPFFVGLLFMLLVLRPAFDFLSELTGFLSPNKGDYDAISRVIGTDLTWVFIICTLVFSSISIVVVLRRFLGFPEPMMTEPAPSQSQVT
jgi:hypothetical protein